MAAAVDRISRYDNHRRLENWAAYSLRELLTYFLSPPSRPRGGCYYIISL